MFRKTYYLLDAVKRLMIDCGLYRSITQRNSVDRRGNPVPWLSMPAIHFLNSLNLRGARVFEFGSGNSTQYWANREIKSYAAAEYNVMYGWEMAAKNGFYRDNVHIQDDKELYLKLPRQIADGFTNDPAEFTPFDLFFVDGPIQWRKEELDQALNSTCSEGLIFVDDANWLPDYIQEICCDRALCRIDFAGFSPGVSYTKVTSLLFRNSAWLQGARMLTPPGGMHEFPGMK